MGAGSRLMRPADFLLELPWTTQRVCVAGAGVTGRAVAQALLAEGADVVLVDRTLTAGSPTLAAVEALGARGSDDDLGALVESTLLVVSPGWRPDAPIVQAAASLQIPVVGELDLAWSLQVRRSAHARWLAVTGTNGKTSVVTMTQALLTAAGINAHAVGNVGEPVISAVMAAKAADVLVVEASSFQLHRSTLMQPYASTVLNVAPDHLDWHGSLVNYQRAKAAILERTTGFCLYRREEPISRTLIEQADVHEGCRAIGTTVSVPALGEVGVVDGVIVDRAFEEDRRERAVELATVADIAGGVTEAGPVVANALTAVALARTCGVEATAIQQGLRTWQPQPHRMVMVARTASLVFVDDSKATNTHAAAASLAASDRVVWIAGGLAKGASFDEIVTAHRDRLVGAVVLGEDRELVVAALRRHAPDVPVIDADKPDNSPMDLMRHTVRSAAELAQRAASQGPVTVLLAPACASMDRFRDYHERGELFCAAVAELI